MFKLDPSAETVGSGRVGTLYIAPATLVKVFGKPNMADEYKVSGEYIFRAEDGQVFTVYDYKRTNLYAESQPDPETFWSFDKPTEFSVGSHDVNNVDKFIHWVCGKLLEVDKCIYWITEETNEN